MVEANEIETGVAYDGGGQMVEAADCCCIDPDTPGCPPVGTAYGCNTTYSLTVSGFGGSCHANGTYTLTWSSGNTRWEYFEKDVIDIKMICKPPITNKWSISIVTLDVSPTGRIGTTGIPSTISNCPVGTYTLHGGTTVKCNGQSGTGVVS